jgi:hypothetical protein
MNSNNINIYNTKNIKNKKLNLDLVINKNLFTNNSNILEKDNIDKNKKIEILTLMLDKINIKLKLLLTDQDQIGGSYNNLIEYKIKYIKYKIKYFILKIKYNI